MEIEVPYKVLLIGGDARCHAIAEALTKDPRVELYSVFSSRNPGLVELSKDFREFSETSGDWTRGSTRHDIGRY